MYISIGFPRVSNSRFFFVKTDLPFLCIINKNAACVLLFKTRTKYLLKILFLCLSERGKGGNESGRSTGRFSRIHIRTPAGTEPWALQTWGHTAQPAHLPSFTRVPALQGRGTREGAGCLGMEKERPRFPSKVLAQVLWWKQSFSPTFSPALNLKASKEEDIWSPPKRRKGCLMFSPQDPKQRVTVCNHPVNWAKEIAKRVFFLGGGGEGRRGCHVQALRLHTEPPLKSTCTDTT